ncbi:MAG: putative toxin-antitoxin system toxin component, PIN family [Campylobacterota bacterium]|nr:putative toxin-antitoxin system toxin component, PIN family [Campylobacterota bacterium]
MNKIVVDTNVFLSALFSNRGSSFKLLELLISNAQNNRFYSVVSVPLVLEFEEVLLRPKNRLKYEYFSNDDIKAIIYDFIAISHKTKLHFLWRPFLKDSFDDKVLETAINGGASTIITYNIKDFVGVKEKFNIDILTPAQFLQKGVLL